MNRVYLISDHILCSLGKSTAAVWQSMKAEQSGVLHHDRPDLFIEPFWASLIAPADLEALWAESGFADNSTRFEKMCLASASAALKGRDIDPASEDTVFILSTTKGNIDLLEKNALAAYEPGRLFMWDTARRIARAFGNNNQAWVISNACISGVLALITAHDLLAAGKYRNAVVIGADMATEFVISGFQSFKSLSNGPCKPFDLNRDGLNLGEGVATMILSTQAPQGEAGYIRLGGGASANDANHISGPSRTGEGLYLATINALRVAGLAPGQIGFISAHGTATPFNDEMESKAFSRAGLSEAWLNSMKSYFGHTLGAAGIIETVIAAESLRQGLLLKTLGFSEYGVPEKLNILAGHQPVRVSHALKTASGFGGCNAALVLHNETTA